MMTLYITDSSRPLQVGDIIDYYLDLDDGRYIIEQTYEVMKIHKKKIKDALGRIKLIWSLDKSDVDNINQTFNLCEQHLRHFKYQHDSRTQFGKFINDLYIKEKEK